MLMLDFVIDFVQIPSMFVSILLFVIFFFYISFTIYQAICSSVVVNHFFSSRFYIVDFILLSVFL